MATIKLIQRTDKIAKDGTVPIYLRITESRRSRYISTGFWVAIKDWNKERQEIRKSHPDYAVWNDELTQLKSKASMTAIEVRRRTRGTGTAASVKKEMIGKGGGSVLAYAEAYADRQAKTDHFWDARNVRSMIKKLREFAGRDDLSFTEVDRAFLNRFDAHMQTEHGNCQNTRSKNLQILRRVVTHAVQEGLVAPTDDPFLHFPISTQATSKEKLPYEKVQALALLDLSSESELAVVRDTFLFSFYLAGVRFGDVCVLKWEDIQDGRLAYTMMKTRTGLAVKLCPPALEILDKYRLDPAVPDAFIFPLLDPDRDYSDPNFLRKRISSRNVVVNRHLKTLAERIETSVNLSFHIARHSFADYARISGQNLYVISKALGHSKLQTTETYLASFDREAEDGLMDELFG